MTLTGRHASVPATAASPEDGPSVRASAAPLVAPVAAACATIGAATSLTGVVAGTAWLGYVAVAAVLVACTGLALRSMRTPAPLVPLVQLLVLSALVTGVFTGSGVLGVLPGPAALAELDVVLRAAFYEVRTGIAPVEGTASILCLSTIAIGSVAVVVDALAVAVSAPAATGLVLLCVYAVPSALADTLLPWWSFVAGAAGFAGLLAVGGSHRRRSWRRRTAPAAGRTATAASAPLSVVAAALAAGLVAGSTVTAIGTEGSLPGSDTGGRSVPGGLGVNPFTSLRGMLNQSGDVELFRVRGLGEDQRLLRAFTLDTYRPNEGFGLADGPMPAGVPARGSLPQAPGDDETGAVRAIRIEPLSFNDVWLPLYGTPRELSGISDGWYYDRVSGAVFRERTRTPRPYVELASLGRPTRDQLRAAGTDPRAVPSVYVDEGAVDPRVSALTRRITADAPTTFDQVEAVWRHFGAGNGFVYDTETAPATDRDALADFLLNGKRGYCEQFASAMAVMLRTLDIPARVAVGFTSGYRDGETHTITSRDAHAWVEVYFDGLGWVEFDPTPLTDGRGDVPPYLESQSEPDSPGASDESDTATPSSDAQQSASETAQDTPAALAPEAGGGPGSWLGWTALGLALAAVLLTVVLRLVHRARARSGPSELPRSLAAATGAAWLAATTLVASWVHWALALALVAVALVAAVPSVLRAVRRGRRMRVVDEHRPGATDAAWHLLLHDCTDRALALTGTGTVRETARTIARDARLNDDERDDLRTVVTAIERAWYGPHATAGDDAFANAFHRVLDGLRRGRPKSWRDRLFPRSVLRRR